MKRFIFIIFFLVLPAVVLANNLPDFDGDGVSDKDEVEIYRTNPKLADTDGDGYDDWVELNNGYSPHNPEKVKLEDNDFDNDGLTDRMELNFHTDLSNPDSDGDSYLDGIEIANGYDPLSQEKIKLEQRIEIDIQNQKLKYFLAGIEMGKFPVSSGKTSMPTPKGSFKISNKHPKAWSPYGLWMPYWLGLGNGEFGIHELPIWPNGYREGEDHLGIPVSHGCIRLGIGPAELLYNWVEIGTEVVIY